jgi:O-antigen/teichoic acid export membrane protein/CelD/BcsL family acetyltransferase involved in cellulose biosynthesis
VAATDSIDTHTIAGASDAPALARREAAGGGQDATREPGSLYGKTKQAFEAWLADDSHDRLAQKVAGAAFLIRMVSAVLAYGSQIALARWMGAYEFGVFVYVWTWTLLIGGFADAGMAAAAQKFIPEYAERGALAHLRGFIVGSRWFAAGAATALALVAIAVVKLSEPLLDNSAIVPLYIACFCLPIYALCSVQDGIARAYNSVGVGLMPTFILRPLVLLALMAGAHFLDLGSDATTAIICSVVSVWLVGVVQTLLLQRSLKASVPLGERAYALREWLGMSLPIVMVIGFYVLLTYVDIIILQQFRPPEDVAFYHAATKTLTLVSFVYFSVSAATAHRFSEYQSAGDQPRLQEFLSKATTLTFWPSVAVTALVLAFGQLLLMLFGGDFVAAYPLMFVLAIGLLARASIGPSERLLIMVGQQNICAAVYGAAFAVNLVACLALVPYFGGMGAAVSTSLALLTETVLLFFVVRRRLGLHSFIVPRFGAATGENISIVPAQSHHAFTVEFRKPDELHDIKDDWRALCARAIEPNVFFEPDVALNAIPVFGENVVAALVWTVEIPRRLVGLMLVRKVRRNGITPALHGFTNPFSGLSLPLIDRDMAEPTIAALLDHIRGNPQLPNTLLIPFVAEEGPLAAAFDAVLAQRGANFAVFDRHRRALFAPAAERESYFKTVLSSKKRKELRRQRNRLEDSGPLTFSMSTQEDTAAALDDFLTLEASGWKGDKGTAVARDPAVCNFFSKAVLGLASVGQATIARLTQNGRPLAAGVILKSGKGAWFWKVAYDETLSQTSPGVQLTLDLTEAIARDPSIAFIDSCAVPDHPMIDHFWRERLAVADWMIGLNPRRPFALDVAVEHLRRRTRLALKRLYHAIKKK